MGNGASLTGRNSMCFHDVLELVRNDEYNQFQSVVSQISDVSKVPEPSWEKMFALASSEGSILCLELLLQHAKHQFPQGKLLKYGGMAVRSAAMKSQVEVIDLVVSSLGQGVLTGSYAVDENTGRFPIHFAAAADGVDEEGNRNFEAMQERAAQCVSTITTAAPSTVSIPDLLNGNTPFHMAAMNGNQIVCNTLLAMKCKVKKLNFQKQSAYDVANDIFKKCNQRNQLTNINMEFLDWLHGQIYTKVKSEYHHLINQPKSRQAHYLANVNKPSPMLAAINTASAPNSTSSQNFDRIMAVWEAFFENSCKRALQTSNSFGEVDLAYTPSPKRGRVNTHQGSQLHNSQQDNSHTLKKKKIKASVSKEYLKYRDDFTSSPSSKVNNSSKHAQASSRASSVQISDEQFYSIFSDRLKTNNNSLNDVKNDMETSRNQKIEICEEYWICRNEFEDGSGYWYWYQYIPSPNHLDQSEGKEYRVVYEEPEDWALDPWMEYFDEDSALPYFINDATGVTRWDAPSRGLSASTTETTKSEVERVHALTTSQDTEQDSADLSDEYISKAKTMGWTQELDIETGNLFWYHPFLDLSVWSLVDIPGVIDSAKEQSVNLRKVTDWTECWDEEFGRKFWFNDVTQESTWEAPLCTTLTKDDNLQELFTTLKIDKPTEGWSQQYDDESSGWYWYHEASGETTWNHPDPSSDEAYHSDADLALVDDGWEQMFDDESESWYWLNKKSGESSWI